ncbi:unnamed protein product [Nezara viridula]|uniref:Uncharacterized protein n=1 Tax=Nezara viridula TaxID=85310 RepID=A0A9P0HIN1_NEZVI|nr:unnamed protein product [Nezara viridula]
MERGGGDRDVAPPRSAPSHFLVLFFPSSLAHSSSPLFHLPSSNLTSPLWRSRNGREHLACYIPPSANHFVGPFAAKTDLENTLALHDVTIAPSAKKLWGVEEPKDEPKSILNLNEHQMWRDSTWSTSDGWGGVAMTTGVLAPALVGGGGAPCPAHPILVSPLWKYRSHKRKSPL